MNCTKCGNVIPVGRLEALPNTKTCTPCSSAQKVGVIQVITGKNTYSELQFVDQKTARIINRAMRRSGQSPNAGMKGTAKLI
jgi:hypothetical protein